MGCKFGDQIQLKGFLILSPLQKYSRTNIDSGDISLAGEGRLKHFKAEKKIIIYSNPGPSHKLTFGILKTKFPEYSSIIWRDG